MFDFNASLNDVAPASPMKLPVDLMRKEWIVVCCFVLLFKSSSVSVLFDFNASLNDVAPLSLMQFPVYLM